jgi:hypothetical protein
MVQQHDTAPAETLRDLCETLAGAGGDVAVLRATISGIVTDRSATWHLDPHCTVLRRDCGDDVGSRSRVTPCRLDQLLDSGAALCRCVTDRNGALRSYLHLVRRALQVADVEARITADPVEHRWVLLHQFSTFHDAAFTLRRKLLDSVSATEIPVDLYEQLEAGVDRVEIRHHAQSGSDGLHDICQRWAAGRFDDHGQRWWQLHTERDRPRASAAQRRWFTLRFDGATRAEAVAELGPRVAAAGLRRERRLPPPGGAPAATWAIPADSNLVVCNVARRQYQVAANSRVAICVVGDAADLVLSGVSSALSWAPVRIGAPVSDAAAALLCELWGSQLSVDELHATASAV